MNRRRGVVVGAALACLLLALPTSGAARERILRFASDIRIEADASLQVTETIEVQVEGREIRRGILRDFPTRYQDRFGNAIHVTFDVTGVRRDGAPEPWQSEPLDNGVRLRIGRADTMLEHGSHTYEIDYRTTRQLGFFEGYDELYWNVTGNGWSFPIDTAEARITLPAGAAARGHFAYTGPQGATGTDYTVAKRDGSWVFRTTRPLRPREGFTIAISWPAGYVPRPDATDRARWFLAENRTTGIVLVGALLIFGYYGFAWRRFGRDPEPGTIFPQFAPPPNLSPAATRFIRSMAYDRQAYSAALISMATRGFLTIERDAGKYRLTRAPGATTTNLSHGERVIAKTLFAGGDTISLDQKNHDVLGRSVKKLRAALKSEYEGAYFRRNRGLFAIGLIFSILIVISAASLGNQPAAIVRGLIVTGASAILTYLGLRLFAGGDPTFIARPNLRFGIPAFFGFVQICLFLAIATISGAGAASLDPFARPVQSIAFALLGGLNVLFYFLLKRPTLAGREVMDAIAGFRMYLGTAEEARLNRLNPPEKTPQLFEKYLPYALALDLENEWSEKFARILVLASMAPGGNAYHPRWYRGSDWQPGNSASFTRSLSSNLGAAVVSSSTAPGSSSGSGGGGFSGGGGGGGGGGGW